MFNFLASQHIPLPDLAPCEEEDDDVPLKSTRSDLTPVQSQKNPFSLSSPKYKGTVSLPLRVCVCVCVCRRATSTELPMAMRFRHLEKASKEAVGVYR